MVDFLASNQEGDMREEKLRETEEIAETIRALAKPGMKPKALIDAVRKRHPGATRKDVARAAFLSVIMSAEYDPEDTQAFHNIAMGTRDEDHDDAGSASPKLI